VCGTGNEDLAVTCSSCKSYLQSKVDTLDLFGMMWGLMESPRSAFKKVVLSRHKNYVFLLSSLLGMSLVYSLFWYKTLGSYFSNLLTLVGTGLLLGPPLGIVFVFLFSILGVRVARLLGGKATMRNTFAVVSYASLPLVFALTCVFPLELAIFGLDFFGKNPPPIVIKPIVYIALLGFDVLAFFCSWLLLIEGTIVANGFTRLKGMLHSVIVMALAGVCAAIL
jgi:hypothetical protein